MSHTQFTGYRAEIVLDDSGRWSLRCFRLGAVPRSLNREVDHERTRRTYASPGDCATSLRHLLGALQPATTTTTLP